VNGTQLCYLTIAQAAPLIREGTLSPVALTQAFLARIGALNDSLCAFVTVTSERALADAERAEREIAAGVYRGALHGIPVALKDIYDTAGIRTTNGSHLHADRVPEQDCEAARRLRDAGAVLLGKLTTHEFALGGPSWDLPSPPARNPWNTECFTGGSSSGSGAATAAGLAMATLGSDTGGSIRNPAFFCGTSGIKPTYGRVSRRGVAPLSYSLDHCGPLTWTAADGALVLQALAGWDPLDPGSATEPVPDFSRRLNEGVQGLRIGHVRHFYDGDDHADDTVKTAMDASLTTFRELGAIVEDVSLSPLQDYSACNMVIMLSEALAIHEQDLKSAPEKYGEMFRDRLIIGSTINGADVIQAQRLRRALSAELDFALSRYDVLVTAAGWAPAPRLAEVPKFYLFERPILASPFNVSGQPTVSVCNGFSAQGLPVGMQIAAAAFDEGTALRAAAAFEAATGYRDRRPDL
jgi:aspartyl-tRNA(Asn)/glutamyl-tRNA(Gln) amidotransferase subunit A